MNSTSRKSILIHFVWFLLSIQTLYITQLEYATKARFVLILLFYDFFIFKPVSQSEQLLKVNTQQQHETTAWHKTFPFEISTCG